ncbi:MAG: HAD family hydrolase [Xenococcaceae cyanobacterium MO_188.B32]|nr:HAD family hydrolase [Xenococcaceae cyanobacterium MO_188.B32]
MVTIISKNVKFDNIQAILFDKDGTLEDSQTFLRELGIKRARLIDAQIPGIGEPLLMAFGITDNILAPTGLMAVGSHSENEIAAAAYIAETGRSWFEAKQIASNAFTEADKYLRSQNVVTSPLFAGSLEILKLLSAANLKLGILSADSTVNVEKFVISHQLSEYVQLAMGVEQGLNKPEPQLFIQACQRLGVEPAKTIMVGDSQGDIAMAQAASAAGTIGICWGTTNANHLQKADVIITSLEEIKIVPSAKNSLP